MKPKRQILRNSRVAVLAGLIFAAAPSTIFSCGLAWKEPRSSHFEGTDHQGHVSIVEKIGEIGGGAGLSEREKTFPIYLIWNSSYGQISPYAGAGFDIPLLSSRMVALDDGGTFKFDQPDGWWRLFWRDKKNPEILNGQGNWKGVIKGDIITLWADCGDKVTLARGRIVHLESKGRKFDYVYSGERVAEIRENGAAVLKVGTDPNTGEVTGLSMGMDKKIGFEWGQRPRIQNIAGKNLVGGMDPALAKLTLADGTEKNFEFGVDDQIRPTLKIDRKRDIAWNAATKTIWKDREWTYDIKLSGDRFANAEIGRTGQKEQKEFWRSDSGQGEEYILRADGSSIRRLWFTSGRLAGKPRKTIHSLNAEETRVQKWIYDEESRLLRTEDQKGQKITETKYKYIGKKKIIERIVSGKLQEINLYDENGLLTKGFYGNGRLVEYALIDGAMKSLRVGQVAITLDQTAKQLEFDLANSREFQNTEKNFIKNK